MLRRDFGDLQRVETASTAAAREVANGDGTSAAVAGPAAMLLFGLAVLAESIQDDPNNTTLFWVIGPADSAPMNSPNREILLVHAQGGSDVVGRAVAALNGLGFRVTFMNSASLAGPAFAFRYVVVAASNTEVQLT